MVMIKPEMLFLQKALVVHKLLVHVIIKGIVELGHIKKCSTLCQAAVMWNNVKP